ncbi:LuxR family transcriptional regulator [Lentzea tibetensis]|uniref:LuxR family transcriptional regulator n=1 Tax=Lentzea tibetensis TaxID=2591470 RepID=A0A563EWJ2_9PSEU|nr:LuxR C-terminal-related transcriptional regulator [Lentzea tibetensis]TWP51908.1 LuxR family transcriptional regulator [Lentzea tibetensis]
MTAIAACETCGNPLTDAAGGRRYCSNACRQRAYRERSATRTDEHSNAHGDLPTSLDSFVGRRAELTALTRLSNEHRLISLVGPAGAGKTRLAVQFGERHRKDYPDGVWWVGLATTSDPGRVGHVVASALGVRPPSTRPVAEGIAASVGNQKMLLLLDNCEHLLEDVATLVASLLANCPRLRVLVTSREALRVAGEQVFALGELELPAAGAPVDATMAPRFDAVRLFLERANAVDHTFELTEDTVGDVVALCRSLDGMPLAIELAARRIALLTPADILARVGDRLALLTDAPRTTDTRHRTLRAAIEWSYDLLDADEQTAMRRLAVLGWPFDLDLASAACGVDDALNLLAGLENKSLLVSDRAARGATMFRQLESIRLFGRELAEQHGDVPVVHDRVVEWVASVVEPEATRFDPGPEPVRRLDRHMGVLDIAIARTAEVGDWPRHALAVAATAWTANPQKPRGVPLPLLNAALARPELPPVHRSLLAHVAAGHHRARGNWELCRRFATLSYELETALGCPDTTARALEVLASADCYFGDLDGGYARFAEALRLARDVGDPIAVGIILNSLSWTKLQHGDADAATPLVTEAVDLIREHGWQHMLNPMLHTAGAIALARSDFDTAAEMFRESLTSSLEHPTDQFYDLEGLALALIGTGADDVCALSLLATATAVRTKFDYRAEPYWQDQLSVGMDAVLARTPAGRARAAESSGRRMSMRQAVDYALTDRPALPENGGSSDKRITERERHIAGLVAEGLTYRQIGQRLGISPHTVARHVTHVRSKLGLRSRAQLAVWAGRNTQ